MAKENPYFVANGKTYEIKRTRFLECEYERISKQKKLTDEEELASAKYIKLQSDYAEVVDKYNTAKDEYFNDVLDETKKGKYLAFKALVDDQYKELTTFAVTNKDFDMSKIENTAYENGLEVLYAALEEQHNLSHEQAVAVWADFSDHLGKAQAQEWVLAMLNELFDREDEEDDPFLKQARLKAQQRAEQRKGLKVVK